jgi:hypothetical protein
MSLVIPNRLDVDPAFSGEFGGRESFHEVILSLYQGTEFKCLVQSCGIRGESAGLWPIIREPSTGRRFLAGPNLQ